MKNLVFKELWILSKTEKKGINLNLSRKVNLLIGENDVGKSTLIKSFYHCLGADTPQINNSAWKRAKPIYCVKFNVAGKDYHMVRDEKYFGVFDDKKNFISRHSGIGGDNGISKFINDLLGFDVKLERQANGEMGVAGPAFYFLPFYIDQDEGWSTSWSSFSSLKQFSRYRQSMIDYHLGVRPQSYYDAKKYDVQLKEQCTAIQTERVSMQAARNLVENRKVQARVDLDPSAFRAELESVVDQYNGVREEQQRILRRLKDIRNQRNMVEAEINVLKKAISELEADYEYSEKPETLDVVGCPTCGTEFYNSFVERFGILDDIENCRALIDQWCKKRNDISFQLEQVEDEYENASKQTQKVQATLARTKENVTLSELIASEGMKVMISTLNVEINDMLAQEQFFDRKISDNADDLRVDGTRKKKIVDWYKSRMKEYLNTLNVGVLSEEDYQKLDKQIKNNALGSDLPRALLAQYFAFLSTMNKFSSYVLCPMLIDSPFQQEQDPTNKKAILDFILSKTLKDQQLILATVSVDEFAENAELEDAMRYDFCDKHSLLRKDQYRSVLTSIDKMHSETLAPSIAEPDF